MSTGPTSPLPLGALAVLVLTAHCGEEGVRPTPVSSDCSDAWPLALGAEVATSGLYALPAGDGLSSNSCMMGQGAGYFQFTLSEERQVAASVGSEDGVSLGLLGSCADTPMQCGRSMEATLPAGTYYLQVSGPPESSFSIGLSAAEVQTTTVAGPPVPLPEAEGTCASPKLVRANSTVALDWTGSQIWDAVCDERGRTQVLQLELSERTALAVASEDYHSIQMLEGDCDGPELLCERNLSRWFWPELDPGTYTFRVSLGSNEQNSTISFETLPITEPSRNTSCSEAEVVPLDTEVRVDFSRLRSDPNSCRSDTPRLFYRVNIPAQTRVEFERLDGNLVASFTDQSCGLSTVGLSCQSFGLCAAGFTGAHTFMVEPSRNEAANQNYRFRLRSLEAGPVPVGNTCSSAPTVNLSSGSNRFRVEVDGASPNADGRRMVWREIVVPQRMDLRTYAGEFHRGCEDTSLGQALFGFGPGSLWLGVQRDDSLCRQANPVDVDVFAAATPPAPSNDTCATATPIVFRGGLARLEGTTRGAFDSVSTSQCPSQSAQLTNGGDVFYTFELAAEASLRFVRRDFSASNVAAYIARGDCTSAVTVACVELNRDDPISLAAGRYILRVDRGDERPLAIEPEDFDYILDLR